MNNANARLLALNPRQFANHIKTLGKTLGFTDVRIARPDTERAAVLLKRWQDLHNHGDMHYLQRHGLKRGNIRQITPDCVSVISVSLNYLPDNIHTAIAALDTDKPYISLYARHRDYHKVMRKMLTRFAKEIEELLDNRLSYRGFVDTAPVLDKAYAEQAGIGWTGKHSNILDRFNGSFYFLGELAINVKLPADSPVKPRCGSCTACIDVCPTHAITAPYQLDAEKCISYLTIEHHGIIPDVLKPLIGNRIYGCDDCQLFCPWNRYAKPTKQLDFLTREVFVGSDFLTLFAWDEVTFLRQTEGSPIRRIGHAKWQRNLAIAIGNSMKNQHNEEVLSCLKNHRSDDAACRDAVAWAIKQLS